VAVDLHHQVAGPAGAPVLVLGSSLGTTAGLWDAQAAALVRHFRLVRYDLRGHGQSPLPPGPYDIVDLAQDVVALLDRLGVERAHLGGLSLGGMVSLCVAARWPERVERLVVCATAAQLGPAQGWADRAAAARAGGMAAVADTVLGRWFTPAFRARRPDQVARVRAMLLATPVAGYAACCGVIERMDLRPELAAIRAPTLAIAAADDPATPPHHLAAIAAGVAHGRTAVVGAAAHLVNIEQPEAVTDLIVEHLREGTGVER
jgi:3-oxoadipate enol-lactonase